jgi:hypothetical protein
MVERWVGARHLRRESTGVAVRGRRLAQKDAPTLAWTVMSTMQALTVEFTPEAPCKTCVARQPR